jgi:alpha-L-fucosidase 2
LFIGFSYSALSEQIHDIEFAKADGVSLKLDVNVPEDKGPFPMVILLHGGPFTNATQRDFIFPLFAPLTEAGYTWFSVDYRTMSEARFPAWVEDVETAIRWIKAHAAEFKGDPSRVALIGESFGGYTAGLVAGRATNDTRIDSLILLYAPFADLQPSTTNWPAYLRQGFGVTNDTDFPHIPRAESLATYLTSKYPPTLLIHGTADTRVPYAFSVETQKRMLAAGIHCELVTVTNAPHGISRLSPAELQPYTTNILRWLNQTLSIHPVGRDSARPQ